VEHGQPSYGSNFEYTLTGVHLGQSLTFTPWQSVELELIRDGSAGTAPLQKQPLLGGPQALRGYPRDFRLVHEQLAAARLEYHWTLTRAVIGREIQSRRIQLILFSDVGKSWDNRQDVEKAPQRQDVGIGVEFDVNVVGFVLFPARLEIAIPYDDPEYKTLKVILFQALSFF
jgi:hemolysin activation/secretion protein